MNVLRRRPRLALTASLTAAASAVALASGIALNAPADASAPMVAHTPAAVVKAAPAPKAPEATATPAKKTPAKASVTIPAAWAGTALAETNLRDTSAGTYWSLVDYDGRTSLTTKDLTDTELLGAGDITVDGITYDNATCATGTRVGGAPATCTLTAPGKPDAHASVALSKAPYGHTVMTARFSTAGAAAKLPTGTPIIHAHVYGAEVLAKVTPAKVADGLTNDALISMAPDSDGPAPKVITRCALSKDRLHATCTVKGTPKHGADGTWTGTLQITPDQQVTYLFGRTGR